MLGLGAIAWGREMWRLAARGDPRLYVMTYAVMPLILVLGAGVLAGTLIIEHATLAVFL